MDDDASQTMRPWEVFRAAEQELFPYRDEAKRLAMMAKRLGMSLQTVTFYGTGTLPVPREVWRMLEPFVSDHELHHRIEREIAKGSP